MLALPFLIGGVSFDLFLATICMLPVLMLLAVTMSLLASVLTREDGAAVVLASVLLAVVCLLPLAIYQAQAQAWPGVKLSTWWLRLSPAYGPHLLWKGFYYGFRAAERAVFWQNLAITLCWSALALGSAAFALKRVWREREAEHGIGGWRERLRELLHGGRESRQRLGRAWLDKNPFVWLAGRDRQPATLGWLAVGGIVVAWLLWWVVEGARWPSALNFFTTATLLNSALSWLTRHTAAQAVGLPRRDGTYELLLTTPLHPTEIVWGTLEALQWQFRALTRAVLSLNVLMMLAGLPGRQWTGWSLLVYFVIWLILLNWTWNHSRRWSLVVPVMWTSLICGRPVHAVWRGSGFNSFSWLGMLTWVWILSNLPWQSSQRFPTGSALEVALALWVAILWVFVRLWRRYSTGRAHLQDMMWDPDAKVWRTNRPLNDSTANPCETRLIREFREIVREPLPDPKDPRYKQWKVRERFPWGWGIIQEQLHERLARR
jgi:hypothetical protein